MCTFIVFKRVMRCGKFKCAMIDSSFAEVAAFERNEENGDRSLTAVPRDFNFSFVDSLPLLFM